MINNPYKKRSLNSHHQKNHTHSPIPVIASNNSHSSEKLDHQSHHHKIDLSNLIKNENDGPTFQDPEETTIQRVSANHESKITLEKTIHKLFDNINRHITISPDKKDFQTENNKTENQEPVSSLTNTVKVSHDSLTDAQIELIKRLTKEADNYKGTRYQAATVKGEIEDGRNFFV